MQFLYNRIFLKEIIEELNKGETYHFHESDGSISLTSIFPKLFRWLHEILVKLFCLFVENSQFDSKFTCICKGPQNAKSFGEKKKVEG